MTDPQTQKIENLVKLAERLIEAIEGDIAALKAGTPQQMRTTDPEIQKLSALYGREAQGLTADAAKAAPAPLRMRFAEVTRNIPRAAAIARPPADPGAQRVRGHDQGDLRRGRRPRRAHPHLQPARRRLRQAAQAMVFNSVV